MLGNMLQKRPNIAMLTCARASEPDVTEEASQHDGDKRTEPHNPLGAGPIAQATGPRENL